MRYLSYCSLSGFYLRALDPANTANRPLIVHRDDAVLDCNARARARGIALGMGLAEAKTLLARDADYHPWNAEHFAEASEKWLDVCANHANAIEPVDQHTAFVDLSDHPNPRDVAERLRKDIEQASGCRVSVGLAGSRWVATLAAGGDSSGEALRDPARFVEALPPKALPIEPALSGRLKLLGCQRIGDVAKLSVDTLRTQFGRDAFAIAKLAHGEGDAAVAAIYPKDSLSERFAFDGPPSTLEAFGAGLTTLAQSLGVELVERDLSSNELDVALEFEDGRIERMRRSFSKPIASPASLFIGLKLMCGEPKAAVLAVRARVLSLKKSERIQRTLKGTAAASPDQVRTALAHVASAFGSNAVTLASMIQEPRFKQVRRAWRSANGWPWH